MKFFNRYLISAIILLLSAIVFLIFAFNHPELSFPWDNKYTYTFYIIYIFLVIMLFFLGLKGVKK